MKKFSFLLALSLVIKLASIGLGLYTSRWLNGLDAAVFAQYNQINALNTIILAIILFGIPSLIQKIYTKKHTDYYREQAWTIFMIIRAISYIIGAVILFISLPFTAILDWPMAFLLYSIQFLLVIDLHFRSIADAVGKSWWFSLTDFMVKFIVVGVLFTVQINSYPLTLSVFLWAITIAYSIGLGVDFSIFKKYSTLTKNIDFDIAKKLVRPLFYVSLTAFIVSFYSGADILILGKIGLSNESINGYSNAYKIFSLALVIPSLIIPPLASYVHKNYVQQKIQTRFQKITTFLLPFVSIQKRIIIEWSFISFVLGVVVGGVILVATPLIIWLIDPTLRYPDAIPSLWALSIGLAIVFPTSFLTNLLIFSDGEKTEFFGILFVAVVSLIGYAICIPLFGAVGAAIATSLYLLVDFIIKAYSISRFVRFDTSSELNPVK